ncbi:ABC transporter substrate-binding protein [Bifidobacterium aemilianum]|uniref:ABC transporter substrate-binding protein n=1 Tax=Bifidobacterium aemilianum TaxID=2493120 RepID=A0A366KB91_9BIFI|nr:MetQ/NlpA family ABC transporter substrate-binding protein [Bifidobacterium aemilianum]RBP98512.1 ABC transporter substrate-binding protein [Bifidobacterium aemilianum]
MATGRSSNRKRRAKIELTILSAFMVVALVVICGISWRLHAADRGETKVAVSVIGSSDDQIWDAVQQELDRRGDNIHIVLKPFQEANYVDQVLANHEVDISAAVTYAYLANDVKINHYKLAVIGDTYISPMNLYSKRYKSPKNFPDGSKVAIPNNAINMGRALKVLQQAGLIELKDPNAMTPNPEDIISNPKNLDIVQTDPAGIINLLPDYAGGVVNANFVIDAGMSVHEAIFTAPGDLTSPANHPYVNILVAREEDKNNPTYKKVVDAYHTKAVADMTTKIYKGANVPVFKY